MDRLIAEAMVLAGGQHQCEVLGHKMKSIGGRACPFHEEGCGNASQTVYECESCGETDYGEPGSLSYRECQAKHFNCGGCAEDRL